MNTKWEESFEKDFSFASTPYEIQYRGETIDDLNVIKAFIKDQITKAQQEIAEQIINDIPDFYTPADKLGEPFGKYFKAQLRKKYIKETP